MRQNLSGHKKLILGSFVQILFRHAWNERVYIISSKFCGRAQIAFKHLPKTFCDLSEKMLFDTTSLNLSINFGKSKMTVIVLDQPAKNDGYSVYGYDTQNSTR